MNDPYSSHVSGLESPASDGFAVTPDDTNPLPSATRALYVGGGGDVTVTMKSGATVTFKAVAGGAILPVRVVAVAASGTTATDLVGLA
jgi:hypothetical protein